MAAAAQRFKSVMHKHSGVEDSVIVEAARIAAWITLFTCAQLSSAPQLDELKSD